MLWQPGINVIEEVASGTVTTSGTATVKGTPTQMIAATARDTHVIVVTATGYGLAVTASEMSMDLLVGASTEEILVANMLGGYAYGRSWMFPIYIAAGTRIAIQAAGVRLSTGFVATVTCIEYPGGPPFPIGGRCTTYGMGTVPNGTAITPGASGAEGSWTQITSATTDDHMCLVPSFQVATDTTTQSRNISVDMGVGAATEEPIAQNYMFTSDANEDMTGPATRPFAWCKIPTGQRLVMRASNNGTNDAAYNGVIHALS